MLWILLSIEVLTLNLDDYNDYSLGSKVNLTKIRNIHHFSITKSSLWYIPVPVFSDLTKLLI